jgi:hypothetical protein
VEVPQTFRSNKTVGNVAVPIMGSILLLMVGVRFSRGIEWWGLSSIALGGAVVGAAYYQLRRGLESIDGTTSDKTLSKLCLAANSMAIFGYGICIGALAMTH